MSRNTYSDALNVSKKKFNTKSNGMNAIVVIINQSTKMIQLKATTMNISSEGIAKIYRDNIWKLHGVPRKILSDQGP